jgi:hypothetical protein
MAHGSESINTVQPSDGGKSVDVGQQEITRPAPLKPFTARDQMPAPKSSGGPRTNSTYGRRRK